MNLKISGNWVIFLLASIIYAIGAATRAGVPGIIFDTLRQELHFTASQTAGISSAGVLGCLIFIGFSGFLIDRYGWKKLILAGVFLQILGEWILYSNTELSWIYVGSFINGGGRTIGYLTLLKLLDLEFNRRYFSLLIGVFYIFSYGGTFLGSSPFEYALSSYSWQSILAYCNQLTFACGIGIGLFFLFSKNSAKRPNDNNSKLSHSSKFKLTELFAQIKKRQCAALFYCTAAGIAIYWSILAGPGKKYLSDICQLDSSSIGIMNIIVTAEMISAGAISFFYGNRRKIFQVSGAILLFLGVTTLFYGSFLTSNLAAKFAPIGFILLGAGYGFTVINITACREFVPPTFAASAIGLVNFFANIAIIVITQFSGYLFDHFSESHLRISPKGYQILFGLYVLITFLCTIFASKLRDSKGENISQEI